ncbi:hypothetical protein T440DRAFT_214224 [Plenodomus tracheiphilus IPT5]|uniref:Uncharacterized protein n=1 Tax=Plenodomus tracheiphilus IPT5 TaxID=1408161 RepID=A0A6A7AVP8_9PLEO|nr:hypothetical protein T440DRAFT_214224 [Plenodomus tracheiphilus IPT5]
MCMKDVACSASARCPPVLAAAARLWAEVPCGHPTHTDGELQDGAGLVRVTSWEGGRTPGEAWMADGDSGAAAGRRGLDATWGPPMGACSEHDLLPATSAGDARQEGH